MYKGVCPLRGIIRGLQKSLQEMYRGILFRNYPQLCNALIFVQENLKKSIYRGTLKLTSYDAIAIISELEIITKR